MDLNTHNVMHKRDLSSLNAQVAEHDGSAANLKIAVFSHPNSKFDPRVIDPRHVGSRITSSFWADLSNEKCFKSGGFKLWAFGHTHYNCNFVADRDGAGPLRLVAN